MKTKILLALTALALAIGLSAVESYAADIRVTTIVADAATYVTYQTALREGSRYSLRCDQAVGFEVCHTQAGTASEKIADGGVWCIATSTSQQISDFSIPRDIDIPPGYKYLSIIGATSAVSTCHLYRFIDFRGQ